jgi:hypothetical protein
MLDDSLIGQKFVEGLHGAVLCLWDMGQISEQKRNNSCPSGSYILAKGNKQSIIDIVSGEYGMMEGANALGENIGGNRVQKEAVCNFKYGKNLALSRKYSSKDVYICRKRVSDTGDDHNVRSQDAWYGQNIQAGVTGTGEGYRGFER